MKTCIILCLLLFVIGVQSELVQITSEIPQGVQLSEINGWTQSRSISTLINCKGFSAYGPFGTTSNIQKTFSDLPPHYSASVSMEIFGIRSIDGGDDIFTEIDGQVVHTISNLADWHNANSPSSSCDQQPGATWRYYFRPYPIDLNVTHTGSSINVKVRDDFTQSIPDEGWAISRLDVYVDRCHQSCLTCNGPSDKNCLTCPSGATSFGSNQCRCDGLTFAKDNSCVSSIPSDYVPNRGTMVLNKKCSQNCSDCIDTQNCTTCQAGYYLSHGFCYDTCPSYTTVSGNDCIDQDFNDNTNLPSVINQDFVNLKFVSSDVKANGWNFSHQEFQTQNSIDYYYTSYSTDQCNGKSLALGYALFRHTICDSSSPCTFTKTFNNLPPHHSVQIKVQFWAGGLWQGETLDIKFDSQTILSQSHTTVSGTLPFNCGLNQPYKDYIYDLSGQGSHSSQDLTVTFEWTNSQKSLNGWAAFRDFQITTLQCNPKCASCSDSLTCDTCIPSRTNAPNCDQAAPGYFDDMLDKIVLPKCNVQCAECVTSPDNCTKCRYYDDPQEVPRCNKPRNCLTYGGVRSVGYQHYTDSNGVGGKTEFYKNGSKILDSTSRGINIVQFDQDAEYIEHKSFDTCGQITKVDELIIYINNIPLRNIVMVGIYDEAMQYMTEQGLDALSLIGWDKSLNVDYRDAYAFIGRRTSAWHAAQAQMLVRDDTPRYAAYVEECLVQCEWQCAECSGTPSNCTKCRYYTATPAPTCGQPTNCLTYVKTESAEYVSGNYYRTYINGDIPSGQTNSRGMNLVIMDGNGTIHEQVRYDTCGSASDVTNFINKLDSIPSDRYVILGMKDEASGQLKNNSGSYTAMESIGWPQGWQLYGRDPFSLIGKKGATSDEVLWQIGRYTDPGQTSVQQCIQDCSIKCATCSSDSTCDTCSSDLRQNDCSLPTNCGKFVYIKSTGFHYSKYQSNGIQIQIYVNDIDITFSQEPGLHFVLFDDQGQIDDQQVFNYSNDSSQLTAMITWINNISEGRKVIIGCNGDMQENMTAGGYTALQSLGLSDQVQINFREPFAMVGEKGATQGTWEYSTGVAIPGAAEFSVCALGCQYQCATCQMETYTCLSCSHSTRSSTPDCACDDGKYDVGIPQCSTCNYKCATCVDNATNCLTCSDTNRVNDGNCNCKDGYYNNGTNPICVQCPAKYETCTNASTGTKCQGQNRTSTLPNCPCENKYYDDNINSNCVACSQPCDNCVDSATKCTSCIDGYYLDGNDCIQCPSRFETCSNATTGIKCQGQNRSSQTPNCPCNDKYFDDNVNANCVQCSQPCDNCVDTDSKCTSCIDGYYLNNNNCIQCPSKYETCSNENTGTKCQGDNRSSILPACPCNMGYYDDNTNANCVICPTGCSECNSGTVCTQCEDGYYQDGNNCIICLNKFETCSDATTGTKCQGNNRSTVTPQCVCEDGYFDDGTNKANCDQCNSPCKTCEDTQNKCLSCIDGYYLDGNSCIECPNKFDTCSSSTIGITCASGTGRTGISPNCECQSGYFDDGTNSNNCVICEHPCIECQNNSTECVTCHAADNRNNAPNCNCQDGYFEENDLQCLICTSPCSKCVDTTTKCTECINTANRIPTPSCLCENGYFENESLVCQVCEYPCTKCTGGPQICDECVAGSNRIQDNTCGCEDGYFDNGSVCEQCDLTKCSTCQGSPTQCIICADHTRGGENCDCLKGYFEEGVAQCGVCDYQCETCSGASNSCDSCSDINRINDSQCQCKDTYYDDGIDKCSQCQFPCVNCQSKNVCTTCAGENRQPPHCTCDQGYYDNNNVCEVCEPQCKSCDGLKNTCITCSVGKLRTLEPPTCGCKKGFYQVEGSLDCESCYHGCKTCEDYTGICTECNNKNFSLPDCTNQAQTNTLSFETNTGNNSLEVVQKLCDFQCQSCESQPYNCTSCIVGLNRNQNIPECTCKDGYHDNNNSTNDCYKCHTTCKQCNSYDQCSSCYVEQNRILNPINLKCECMKGFTQHKDNRNQCVPCFQYKGKCFEQCPQNTIQDSQQKICIETNINAMSNTSLLVTCGAVLVVVQLALKKLGKLIKAQKLPQQDKSKTDEEIN